MALSDRIKEARLKSGLTQEQLADKIGAAKSTVTGYEKGNRIPPAATVGLIADATNVDANFLYQDEVKERKENNVSLEELSMIKKYRLIKKHSPDGASVVDTVLDREYSIAEKLKEQKEHIEEVEKGTFQNDIHNADIRLINYYYRLASAGTGQIVFDMPPTKKIEIPDVPEYKKVDYAIGVNGDSMEPEYNDGDILLIEMTEDIENGEIGIFIVEGESYVKKLGRNELVSLNPEYGNIPLTENSKCMGKVVDKL